MTRTLFISSPFKGLARIRARVRRAAQRVEGWRPIAAEEIFRTSSSWDARLWSVHEAARCNAGFVILDGRYGSDAPGLRVSYTHLEIRALLAAAGSVVALQLPGASPDRPRRYAAMLAELRDAATRVSWIEAPSGMPGSRWLEDALALRLEALQRLPAPAARCSVQLVFAASALQSRLWRITNANHQSFRGAYKTLRDARAALDTGRLSRRYRQLDAPDAFVRSTIGRFGYFARARAALGRDLHSLRAVDACLCGRLRWGDHPLQRLYGESAVVASDWRADLGALVSQLDLEPGSSELALECEGLGALRELRRRYPTLAGDLLDIVDTDLVAVPEQARRSGYTWNRLKLLSNALVDLVAALDPQRRLVPARDRAPLRFRQSWSSRTLAAPT